MLEVQDSKALEVKLVNLAETVIMVEMADQVKKVKMDDSAFPGKMDPVGNEVMQESKDIPEPLVYLVFLVLMDDRVSQDRLAHQVITVFEVQTVSFN